jgi:Tfp pilus assembly protein PilN
VINKLNLSSNPFRNRTLPYLIAIVLLGCALAGTILSFAQWRKAASENEIAKNDIERIEQGLKEQKAKAESIRESLSPDQKQLMVAGHKLVANKEFGWSRLLSDIERVLPGSVSASRINVENIYKENDRIKAELEFSVLAKSAQPVIEMIDRMNNSGIFRASLRGQDRQESDTIIYSEFTLSLIYQPGAGVSLAAPPNETAQVDANTGGNQ